MLKTNQIFKNKSNVKNKSNIFKVIMHNLNPNAIYFGI
jgi:hypothetical protein